MLKIGDTVKIDTDRLKKDGIFNKNSSWINNIKNKRYKIVNFFNYNDTIELDKAVTPYSNIVYKEFLLSTLKEDRKIKLDKLYE